jgi:hypothetical protein
MSLSAALMMAARVAHTEDVLQRRKCERVTMRSNLPVADTGYVRPDGALRAVQTNPKVVKLK